MRVMHIHELDYILPEHLIAQKPAEQRDQSRLMIVDRRQETIALDIFSNLPGYLIPGDCLVMNDTRVIRARLRGHKPTGGRVELFLLRELGAGEWEALVKPSAKVADGTAIDLGGGVTARVFERICSRSRRVVFDRPDVLAILEARGEIPLPPYVHRDEASALDAERYQTVYAQHPGAVAAPTAGLHYTPALLEALQAKGIATASVTLHVGYGTFRPIETEQIEDHRLEAEHFEVPDETCRILDDTRAHGGRIVAVGTTVTRVLESRFDGTAYRPGSGETAHYIHPPYAFRAIDALQTNFHLPRTSLLALVYAFGGTELMRRAYREAIDAEFRFYSYGDTMLIL
jgi:S-adenosylmethionine:tRNA ribosyltransferase-isomerase